MPKKLASDQLQRGASSRKPSSVTPDEEHIDSYQQNSEHELLTVLFERGHILYGLDAPREKALRSLSSVGFPRESAHRGQSHGLLAWVIKYLRKKKTKRDIIIQNDITNSVWDNLKPLEYSDDQEIGSKLNDPERAIEFKAFLSKHPKYNVKSSEEAKKINKNLLGTGNLVTELWKRTSKAGLEFQLYKRKQPLHFMADVIRDTLDKVATKNIQHGKSITSSELRWLYRHKDSAEVKENLKFYQNEKLITHEDVFDNDAWSKYKPKHTYS